MRTYRSLIGVGLGLLALAGCSASYDAVATNPCPPRMTTATVTTPRLASGGTGVEPRVIQPGVDEGVAAPSEPHLASSGHGVPERMVTSPPIGGAGTVPTPHLIAMPQGTSGPRVECR
jgi:hypothetical protein